MRYAALLTLTCVVGCMGETEHTMRRASVVGGGGGITVSRFHDDSLPVTCWVADGYEKGGLACLPDALVQP